MKYVFCCQGLGDDRWCYRLDGECPIHDDPVEPAPAGKRPAGGKLSDTLHEMMDRVLDGTAAPSTAVRLIRAWTGLKEIPLSAREEEELKERELAIIELSAGMMHGVAPRDEEEWELAVEEYGLEMILESFRFMLPGGTEPIPISIVERLLDLAEKKNYPPFRIPSRMLNPQSRPGEPFRPLLPYPRIDHDPGGWMGPREFCEEYEWHWFEQGKENGVMYWDTGPDGEKIGKWIGEPREGERRDEGR